MRNQHDQGAGLNEAPHLRDKQFCDFGSEGWCPTCSDNALPARVLSVGDETGLALVEVEGTTAEIDVTLVDAVVPGDWLLTHGGVAIGRLEAGCDSPYPLMCASPGRNETDEICG